MFAILRWTTSARYVTGLGSSYINATPTNGSPFLYFVKLETRISKAIIEY